MKKFIAFLTLPDDVGDFEAAYLSRVNRVALFFFAFHLPVFTLIAWLNRTGPATAAVSTLLVLTGPVSAHFALRSPRSQSMIHGITAVCMGGLLVHFGRGPVQIEMHFYFFALLAMCAVFGNPLVIVASGATAILHQLVGWLIVPASLFNYPAAWWVVAVHAGFVMLESIGTCFIARSFFDNVIGLEKIVQARTQTLDEKNRNLRVLLDNSQQGFLTIDHNGILVREHSAAIDTWFGAQGGEASFFDYLARISASFADRSRLAWVEVVDGVMPLQVTLEQMPHQLSVKGAHYRFDYRPIGSASPHGQYLVIVTDVTVERMREHAELERREALALFERLLADRSGFQSFFEEATDMVELLVEQRSTASKVVKRLIHTLKGNAAMYGLTSVAQCCEELEDYIAEQRSLPPGTEYTRLKQRWASITADVAALLGARAHSIEIEVAEYDALEAAAEGGESARSLLQKIRSLKLEPAAKRLGHFQEQAGRIAERLGKGDTIVAVEAHCLRLEPRRWAGFWGAFGHALRNALDHGIEPTSDRIAAGKSEPAQITLRAYDDGSCFGVEIADNGRGIDWLLVAARAASRGLPAATRADLERALFVDGISTAAEVTDISGRGVGMGALLAATQRLGGSLTIESTLNVGTTLRFCFPPSAAHGGLIAPLAAAF
ncbi:MAG: Hpt domain-containing protein [Polyangiaceae bacterium]